MSRPKRDPYDAVRITLAKPLLKELDAFCYLHGEKRSRAIEKAVSRFLEVDR